MAMGEEMSDQESFHKRVKDHDTLNPEMSELISINEFKEKVHVYACIHLHIIIHTYKLYIYIYNIYIYIYIYIFFIIILMYIYIYIYVYVTHIQVLYQI